MQSVRIVMLAVVGLMLLGVHSEAQSLAQLGDLLEDLVEIPAVSSHEGQLTKAIAERLRERELEPEIDRMSNVTVTIGSGSPHRLLVANIDEPDYMVLGWTDDGYLRMNRIGLTPSHPHLDQYFEGHRLWTKTSRGQMVPGVTSIPSTHLRRGLNEVEQRFNLADAYIDIGAGSVADIQELGIRLMDPISLEKSFHLLAADRVSEPFLSDRVGAAAILSMLTTLSEEEILETLTVTFVTQEHFGRRGIDRMSVRFDVEQVFAFEVMDFESDIQTSRLGSGIGVDAQAAPGFVEELTRFDGMVRDEVMAEAPDSPRWNDGAEVVQLGVPILFYQTPVEVLDLKDLRFAVQFLRVLVTGGQS